MLEPSSAAILASSAILAASIDVRRCTLATTASSGTVTFAGGSVAFSVAELSSTLQTQTILRHVHRADCRERAGVGDGSVSSCSTLASWGGVVTSICSAEAAQTHTALRHVHRLRFCSSFGVTSTLVKFECDGGSLDGSDAEGSFVRIAFCSCPFWIAFGVVAADVVTTVGSVGVGVVALFSTTVAPLGCGWVADWPPHTHCARRQVHLERSRL